MEAHARWFRTLRPNGRARLRLFCLPYAGGAAAVFQGWPDLLPMEVEVCALELPGRGARLLETPHRSCEALVRDLADALSARCDRPYVLFGHSLGALLAFELVRELRRRSRALPRRLIVAGAPAPDCPPREQRLHELSDRDFVAAIRELGGTPSAVLDDAELMSLLLPGLRADFEILAHYRFAEETALELPIAAFGGLHDPLVRTDDVEGWLRHTRTESSVSLVPGGHFFLNTHPQSLLPEVCLQLKVEADRLGRGPAPASPGGEASPPP